MKQGGSSEITWFMRKTDEAKQDILSLIDKIHGENLTLVEIGSYMGESAVLFAQSGKFGKIVCVDPWANVPGHDGNAYYGMNVVEKIFDNNTRLYSQIVKFKGVIDGLVGSNLISNGVDIVYIDGIHTYEGCMHDIDVCRRFIKPKLAFSGHDYTDKIAHVVGVKKAVDEAFGRPDFVFCNNSWIKFAK